MGYPTRETLEMYYHAMVGESQSLKEVFWDLHTDGCCKT